MSWPLQTRTKPLYEKTLWSRPERKSASGKVLVIGGHKQEFVDAQIAYEACRQAGAGESRVILPDVLQKLLPPLPDVMYAPSTPAGSLAQEALPVLSNAAQWSDAVILSGELSSNSETQIMINHFLVQNSQPAVLCGDSLRILDTQTFHEAPNLTLICTINDIHALTKSNEETKTITSQSTPADIREVLLSLRRNLGHELIFHRNGMAYVACEAPFQMSIDTMNHPRTASYVAVLKAQFPSQAPEAIATALYLLENVDEE